ncbi:MAG: anthranilate phosphoribosyltransferase [Candidatus Omnitrophica bacterium]|nr:anthranilate phosphoribosyltransferase [Candidatus Omnitrophota bacterium]MCF7893981.1 anthranilate phosphoribosyltransferase [Candidatus Omnitrophota bacterium]
MIQNIIAKLVDRKNLTFEETKEVFEEIFDQKINPAQIASFLTALKMKGETETEISAAATVVRKRAKKIKIYNSFLGIEDEYRQVLDTCGTGGSGVDKFNISTAVAFVVAASGIKVAKHGNKAMSSGSGSADVLEQLGINVGVGASVMEKSINEIGIGFLYAPLYHPALKTVAQIRKQLKMRTIFNLLGPLSNPAFANFQLLGVYSQDLVLPMAKVLKQLGVKKALVVFGKDLKDEISLTGSTQACLLNKSKIKKITLSPSNFGLKKIKLKDIETSNPKKSAKLIKELLGGKKGPARDVVLANSAACFYILDKVKSFKQGVTKAADILDSKKAYHLLKKFKTFLDKNA